MIQFNISYSKAESCLYEAERIFDTTKKASGYSALRERNSLIDPEKTHLNFRLIQTHPALNPDDFHTHHRGQGIAEYHKSVTGRSARMKGAEENRSKVVCCIITLPRGYICTNKGLNKKEYLALDRYVKSNSKKPPTSPDFQSANDKMSRYVYTEEEQREIKKFFKSALRAWQKVAGIRDEDMLYAIVHMDESFPHLHIMALPTMKVKVLNKETGLYEEAIKFSTSKFNNYTTHYFDNLHERVIKLMSLDGIDASGLLNGETAKNKFSPKDLSRSERLEGSTKAQAFHELLKAKEQISTELKELEENIKSLQTKYKNLQTKYKNLQTKYKSLQTKYKSLQAEIQTLNKKLSLTKQQNEKLKKNKHIINLSPGQKESIIISYELSQAIKSSKLVSDALDKREKGLDTREIELKKKNEKIEERIERIREYNNTVIPETEKKAKRAKELEEEALAKAEENAKKAAELKLQEQSIIESQHDLDNLVNSKVKKRLSEIVTSSLESLFERVSRSFPNHLKKDHQIALEKELSDLVLPEGFMTYGGQTISRARRNALNHDIRDALHEQGISYSDIDSEDVRRVRKALEEGKDFDDAVLRVANYIRKEIFPNLYLEP